VRAGSHALSLLAVPLNVHVLTALAEEPKALTDLRRAVGSPPQTTMRAHLRNLTQARILERRRQNDFPGSVDYQLDGAGRDLLTVMGALEAWLAEAPIGGPQSPGSAAAKSSLKALIDGWDSTMIRALAARPFSLTELNKLISVLNYPSLERRLGALRLGGLVQASPGRTRATPYEASDWLRRAIGPLVAAIGWERQHLPVAPVGRIDIEAIFLLAIPMLSLPAEISGRCRFAVELRDSAGDGALAGIMVAVEEGRIVSCVARLQGDATAWASGNPVAWIRTLLDAEAEGLEVGGDQELAMALFGGLNGALFGAPQRT
jgi:DNA-binding HxlR family transcriptional regulator